MAESLAGRQLGKYEVQRLLGEGGLGAVYLARDPLLDREVALKVLRPALVSDPALQKRFHKEAVAMARLSHPHIIRIYALEQEAELMFLVMEYLRGESLAAITARGALPPATALRHLRQAAEALACAHRQGVLHRDIKSANLMVQGDGTLKVLDFGLAAVASEATMLTQAGEILGTPHYMAPEQALGQSADQRSDLYALGIVLYEMLAGQLPFRGDSALAVLHQQVSVPLPELPAALVAREPGLTQILAKLTAKDPASRFTSAAELLAAIDRHESGENGPLPVPTGAASPFRDMSTGFSTAASAVVQQAIAGYSAARFSSAPPPQFSQPAAPTAPVPAQPAAAAPVWADHGDPFAPAPAPAPVRAPQTVPPPVRAPQPVPRPAARPAAPAVDAAGLVSLATKKYQAGLVSQSLKLLDEVAAAKLMDYRAWKLLGAIAQQQRRNADALAAFRHAADCAEAEPELLNNLGALERQHGRPDAALAMFRHALEKNPRYSAARYNLSLQLLDNGEYTAALGEVNALLAHEPGHTAGRQLRQQLQQQLG